MKRPRLKLEETALERSAKGVLSRLLAYHVPESKSKEAQRARVDPIYFGERYVKPHDARWTSETQPFQIDMVHHILKGSRFDPEILKKYPRPEDAKKNSKTVFKTAWIPIEHAKTTWISIVLPLWMLAVDQETTGYLIGNRQADAMKALGPIKWHIENNQLLRAEFPELRPDEVAGWSDSRIFVERKSRAKDPSINTTGITGTIQGSRLDFVFGDDVQDRTRALSEIKNQGDQEMWQEIIENRVVDGGICATYGTLQTGRDLTATMSRSEGYDHMHLSAISDGRYGEKGQPIWMTKERLAAARKRQGERRFARKYLNDATDEGGKLLKADLLTFVSHSKIPWQRLTYFAGVDPATGETEVAEPDEYAIAWGGRTPEGIVYLLGTMGDSDWNIAEGTKQLSKLHKDKDLLRVAIEQVSFSIAAKQDIWRTTNIPAYGSPTGNKSKEQRFETMSIHFETDRVMVYEGGPGIFGNDEPGEQCFYDQWIDFNEGQHDDRLDAVDKMLEAALITAPPPGGKSDRVREALAGATLT